ncbi:50S ribosomal protein L15 [Candidatus Daviesbacteria bacterium RIFCSPLOWO2_01_FULL_39_12]|uniref:Large ribosomal subunit protein uL15 n=1 Tax=Candidatus Daviesbacteria bacterium RIFCSPLOWO2_01_FULL_39_12 TaxID=1797785 RepID=A0A1F5KM53_9BACT|nr:MAG: 50S ribosomal protein L15 [Candidatus Daviesbacteria bacterium RIFCSPHIGHO2_02_FULL_39_8]OGE41691.1 MAG: 50S ribosomal protein L15 [Candidatus Daviesbacteria bacterium RIFCSPLOWO2_01_FULL_39_12]
MRLHELNKLKTKSKKRLGRGLGSGKGKTAGRGSKGQKARGKIPATFTGTPALFKKLPLRRGKGNPKIPAKVIPLSLSKLNEFRENVTVDMQKLIDQGIIKAKDVRRGVKVVAGGEVSKALILELAVSKEARQQIEKRGGKVR